MSGKTKKKISNWSKIIGITVFTLLFFLNVKVMLNDGTHNGDISLLGVEVSLFEGIYATASCSMKKDCGEGVTASCTGGTNCYSFGNCVRCDSVSSCC